MLQKIASYYNNFMHLIYPHYCEGCGNDAIEKIIYYVLLVWQNYPKLALP